jgi:hypothetical protein
LGRKEGVVRKCVLAFVLVALALVVFCGIGFGMASKPGPGDALIAVQMKADAAQKEADAAKAALASEATDLAEAKVQIAADAKEVAALKAELGTGFDRFLEHVIRFLIAFVIGAIFLSAAIIYEPKLWTTIQAKETPIIQKIVAGIAWVIAWIMVHVFHQKAATPAAPGGSSAAAEKPTT